MMTCFGSKRAFIARWGRSTDGRTDGEDCLDGRAGERTRAGGPENACDRQVIADRVFRFDLCRKKERKKERRGKPKKKNIRKERKRMQMAKVDRLQSAGPAAIEREMTIDRSRDRGGMDGWTDGLAEQP